MCLRECVHLYACSNARTVHTVCTWLCMHACKKKKTFVTSVVKLSTSLVSVFIQSQSLFRTAHCELPSQWSDSISFCISVKSMCRFRVNPCDNQACLSGALWFDWCGWVILTQLRYESKVANQMGRGGTGPGLAHTWYRYTAQSWRQINCRHRSRMQVECVYLKYYLTSAE